MTPAGLFIVGTDTGVGKTRVACWLARWFAGRGVRVGVCKPAATGAEFRDGRWMWDDLDRLADDCPLDVPAEWIGPYRWRAPLAPPVAHRLEADGAASLPTLAEYRRRLELWTGSCDVLIVEGIGGLLCPINETDSVSDLAADWGRPTVVVAADVLGTISRSLMTVEVARGRGLEVKGLLLNRCDEAVNLAATSNAAELRARLPIPVWGPVPYQPDRRAIPAAVDEIDWLAVAGAGP